MVDANHGYSLYDAQWLARRFEELDISWFEEPISPHDLAGYADLRTKTSIPLAGGENAFTRYAFHEIITRARWISCSRISAAAAASPRPCGLPRSPRPAA